LSGFAKKKKHVIRLPMARRSANKRLETLRRPLRNLSFLSRRVSRTRSLRTNRSITLMRKLLTKRNSLARSTRRRSIFRNAIKRLLRISSVLKISATTSAN